MRGINITRGGIADGNGKITTVHASSGQPAVENRMSAALSRHIIEMCTAVRSTLLTLHITATLYDKLGAVCNIAE